MSADAAPLYSWFAAGVEVFKGGTAVRTAETPGQFENTGNTHYRFKPKFSGPPRGSRSTTVAEVGVCIVELCYALVK